ncbi:MAG: tyrosine--tRNA ligase [Endozoicomonadaceae bacterium]|nr:tyrosine--tRNA ligase [Endozoicomonadaceae bacterium]
MSMSSNTLLSDLKKRHLIHQMTSPEALMTHLNESRSIYCGFDPTADSLHIGSLIPLLTLRRFQLAGHRPIALVGGATGLIGDPSFKQSERTLNTPDCVRVWVEQLQHQIANFLDCSGPDPALIVNNLDWMEQMSVLPFLRDIGKYFPVNQMIAKESVKRRLARDDAGISFTEFSYMILQGYDFSKLYHQYDCSVQIGGSDQWGNITCGTELTRRQHQAQVFGLTLPLITQSDGTKFGKTEQGTIWLDANKTSEYAFYQFWRRTADADVYQFLRYFTFLTEDEIQEIEKTDAHMTGMRSAQSILAEKVTCIVHGESGLQQAERITQLLFSDQVHSLSEQDLKQLSLDGLPCSIFTESDLVDNTLIQFLVHQKLSASGKAIKDALIRQSVWLNLKPLSMTDNLKLTECFNLKNALYQRYFLVKLGKKKYHLLIKNE